MKLNVDFTDLELAAAKMHGLDGYLTALRNAKKTYSDGLALAKQFVCDNGGTSTERIEDGVTITTLCCCEERAECFQPYPDIDLFYFET